MELDGASQKRRNLGQEVPPGGGDGHGDPDLISGLPDEVLGCIVTLLPTKDGARTQILSRRWRPLWRSAPLNLQVDWSLSTQDRKRFIFVPKILADHPGPARRFAVVGVRLRSRFAKIDGWLRSPALTGLEEIQFSYEVEDPGLAYPLPRSVLRFAPTLCVAEFSCCEFPNEIAPSLNFPHLKKLVLRSLIVSEDAVRNMLSGCPVLESLWLIGNVGVGRLHISSPTIRSIGFSVSGFWSRVQNPIKLHEVVIGDAPRLKRLLPLHRDKGPATIRVMHAPKLEILGMLSAGISKLELGTTVFQKMIALSLTTSMRTVKILALHSLGPDLNSVVDFLKCFPCVEKLYITSMLQKNMKNARRYNPLDPIECLELHLKKVVLKFYVGMRPDVDFAKFFILNAKVLKEMDFEASNYCNDKWMDNQHRRLQLDNKASPVARFAFGTGCDNFSQSIHSLPKADPFDWRNENFVRSARLFN